MKMGKKKVALEVQRLADQDAISRLLFDYAFYLDMNRIDDLLKLFTPDCYTSYGADHGATGIDEYRQILEDDKVGVGAFFAATSHHVSNVSIDFLDEDTATVRSVLYAWHAYNRQRPDGIVMGQYHDVVVRTTDGWKLKRRELKHAGTENYHAKGPALNPIDREP